MQRAPSSAYLFFAAMFLLLAAPLPLKAQKYLPKTIQFKGAPEYSEQELLAASGLIKGKILDFAEMSGHSQKLMDTGLFETLSFKFDGVDLIYTLVLHTELYPVRLENLPLAPGKELDAALHERFPLYHGKVPAEGGLAEQVRQALEEMLAAKGIKANVLAAPYTDEQLHEVTAVSYSITSPSVQVGELHIDGVATPLDLKVVELVARFTGSNYDVEGSPGQIETSLGNCYRDQGYLETEIHATAQSTPVITTEAVRVPFQVSILTGVQYKISGIQLAPNLLVTQADFDRQARIHPGDLADGSRVRANWQFIERQYHNKGYMKAVVHPTASFDRAQGMVSFTVSVEPGPIYRMGRLIIENNAEDLRAAMWAAWKLPGGEIFDESVIQAYFTSQGDKTPLGRTFASANCKYKLTLNDDTHTVDVMLRLEKRQ
ncbi:MAG TPA: POTRA domain-containing protein [Terracidiphilus sp.]|nr:POTRA domain-containing protein [Terracidiphilus sp.]